ncbi:LapA family protein [Poseidonocella sedimentorum]|uniref:Lipopolysaccharide assembly protein A domain-containing protein n=1 Tax=Poseidonocella sedimentorum TaxID=871652 RepID=A0A1I6DPQ5_9RHOB|nr:LapA family protein [Poseidonocella sedimentorum]SFR07406.1 Protein of unknown function [Poseidonocella sedimentorum]
MRYIRLASIAIFALALVTVGLANRQMVTLKMLPEELSGMAVVTPQINLPLFAVIFFSILVGVLVGFVWEWFREYGIRMEADRKGYEVEKLQREVKRLKGETRKDKDEVLALLEDAG